jgi:hypothetical protein
LSLWALYLLSVIIGEPGEPLVSLEEIPKGKVVALLVVALTATILIGEAEKPVTLEPVSVRLDSGSRVRGIYVTQTSETLYLGQRNVIIGIPNERLRAMRIGPAPKPRSQRGAAERWLRDLFGIKA